MLCPARGRWHGSFHPGGGCGERYLSCRLSGCAASPEGRSRLQNSQPSFATVRFPCGGNIPFRRCFRVLPHASVFPLGHPSRNLIGTVPSAREAFPGGSSLIFFRSSAWPRRNPSSVNRSEREDQSFSLPRRGRILDSTLAAKVVDDDRGSCESNCTAIP